MHNRLRAIFQSYVCQPFTHACKGFGMEFLQTSFMHDAQPTVSMQLRRIEELINNNAINHLKF